MTEYPYMVSNNKIAPIFEKIKSAEVPPKFTLEFLRRLGFTSTNDRAFIPLIKKLGLLSSDGAPTEYYNQLKDATNFGYVIAERVKDLYSEIFSINTTINSASDQEIKGAFSRVTGKDEASVLRYIATFKALLPLANFSSQVAKIDPVKPEEKNQEEIKNSPKTPYIRQEMVDFHYNIQIHLPATTDINIYNAIFKSIKENLIDE